MLQQITRAVRSTTRELWHATHLKSQGHYNEERLRSLHNHMKSVSKWRNFLVVLWVPFPAFLVIVCVDLLPLAPPAAGIHHNGVFWVRTWSISTFMIGTLMLQVKTFMPGLNMKIRDLGAITLFTSSAVTAMLVPLAYLIGFPVPFTFTISSPYTSLCLCTCTALRYGRALIRDDTLRRQLLHFCAFLALQFTLTVVYPVFAFVFSVANSVVLETLLACLLPLTKLFIKIAMARVTANLPGVRPAFLMFNVEVFNALFIASCLQNATSVVTTIVVMAVDCYHNVMTLRNVAKRLKHLTGIIAVRNGEMVSPPAAQAKLDGISINFIEAALYLLQDNDVRTAVTTSCSTRSPSQFRTTTHTIAQVVPISIVPSAAMERNIQGSSTTNTAKHEASPTGLERTVLDKLALDEKVAFVRGVMDLLYVTEFTILIEFVEIIVPVIFAVYLSVVFELPNREYYPQLRDTTAASNTRAVRRVLAYTSLEVVSFVVFERMLHQKIRLDVVRQLGFVLARHWWFLPAKLTLWVSFILQCSIQHYGVDYTFRFAWLRNATTSEGG